MEFITEWPITAEEPSPPPAPRVKRRATDTLGSAAAAGRTEDDATATWSSQWATADIVLARWLRRKGGVGNTPGNSCGTQSSNPHTRLYVAAQSSEGRQVLQQSLDSMLSRGGSDRQWHYAVATHYDRLGDTCAAIRHVDEAARDLDEGDVAWLHAKLHKQARYDEQARARQAVLDEQATSGAQVTSGAQATGCVRVDRVSGEHLSVRQFHDEYAARGRPVIITGVVAALTSSPWSLDSITKVAGDRVVKLRRRHSLSSEWAKLEDGDTMTVRDYVTAIRAGRANGNYLFDWSLPLFCPELAADLAVPKYFANDFLQRTAPGSMYRDSWPSLFIGAMGAGGGLHVDAFGSNFWMALFQGQKRWLFFPPEDTALLGPRLIDSLDPVFDANPDDPTGLARHARACECVLQAGELLFVPAGSAHIVSNLTDTVAVSGNFVDSSNFALVKEELARAATRDPHARALLAQLASPGFDCTMRWDQGHVSLRQKLAENLAP
eukprot:m.249306 g.249306  ORF g.249306 m.249306 type:complete len:494 (+) comp16067_c0_seq1:94-1575(+)